MQPSNLTKLRLHKFSIICDKANAGERNRYIWPAQVLNLPWVIQELLIAKPRGISRCHSWAEQKCIN